jgi:hypothetical protein
LHSAYIGASYRANNVTEAAQQLVDTLKWRSEFNPEKAADEEFPAEIFGRLGILHGKSKAGEPVTYNLYGEIKDNQVVFGDLDRFLRYRLILSYPIEGTDVNITRWRVGLMEKGIKGIDFENVECMVQVTLPPESRFISISSRGA